jgi:ABC-type multidrug transport system fused ATPase/permease subunit
MSLTNLAGSHWTAEAFFVASLVTGALSVFFSCAISPAFHGLYGATDIRNFLTRPTKDLNKLNQILASLKAIASPEAQDKDAHIVDDLRRLQSQWRVPSPAAAVMITVPMSLLNISLNAFLIGLGIYLGKVFTAKLIPSYGLGSLIILIVFVVTTLTGISMFYVAQGFKAMEKVSAVELQKLVEATEDELRRLNGHFDESGRSPSRVPEQTEATANLNSSSTSVPIQPRTLTFNRDRSQRLLTELVELQRHILRTTELLVEAVSESPE